MPSIWIPVGTPFSTARLLMLLSRRYQELARSLIFLCVLISWLTNERSHCRLFRKIGKLKRCFMRRGIKRVGNIFTMTVWERNEGGRREREREKERERLTSDFLFGFQ